MSYESDVMQHKARVSIIMSTLGRELSMRGKVHDNSKLKTPEVEIYRAHKEELDKAVFGTASYEQAMNSIKPALDHHYSVNDHHPEHFKNGIVDMNLIQMLEMLADISAVSMERGTDVIKLLPDFMREKGIPENYYMILKNTLELIGSYTR